MGVKVVERFYKMRLSFYKKGRIHDQLCCPGKKKLPEGLKLSGSCLNVSSFFFCRSHLPFLDHRRCSQPNAATNEKHREIRYLVHVVCLIEKMS